jgi:hypothetical protein
MKLIKSVDYEDIAVEPGRKAVVEYLDGTIETYTDEADLKRIHEQIVRQVKDYQDFIGTLR